MGKRKSQRKRLSGRKADVLNKDTNVVGNDDSLRHNRTATRQSTSQNRFQNPTDILNPDSTVQSSQLSDQRYKHLLQSENSRLQAEAARKKTSSRDANKTVEESEKSMLNETSHSSNIFSNSLIEDTTNTSEPKRRTFNKPGPKFTKTAKHGNSLDRALERARANIKRTVIEPGEKYKRFGDIDLSDKKIQRLINPWKFSSSPTKKSKSPSPVYHHEKYRIVESSTDSENEIVVAKQIRRMEKKIFQKAKPKKVKPTSKESIRGEKQKEDARLSVFKGTAEVEKDKESERSKSLTLNLDSFNVQTGSKDASSKTPSVKVDEWDKLLNPDAETSDGEIYTPTASRVQRRKTDANKNFKGKPRKRLFREKKTTEPQDISDLTPLSENPAAKDKSKEVEQTLRSPVTSQKSRASKRKSRDSSAEESDGGHSRSTNTTERLQELRRRLFESSKDSIDDGLDVNDDGFEGDLELDDVPENLRGSSRTSYKFIRKDRSRVHEAPAYQSLSQTSRPTVPTVIEKNQQSSRKSTGIRNSSTPTSSVSSDHRSVVTSTDGTMITVSPRKSSTPVTSPVFSRRSSAAQSKIRTPAKPTHDSSHTPARSGQSKLKSRGKRLMLFSSDTSDDESDEERTPSAFRKDEDDLDFSIQRQKSRGHKRQRSREDDRLEPPKKTRGGHQT